MTNLKKLFLFLSIIGLTQIVKAQISVTSYSIYSVGVNTNKEKKIMGELKIFANRDVEELIFEPVIFYNFTPRTYHKFSLGLGLSAIPFSSFDQVKALIIPAQLEIFPIQDFKKLSLIFELCPEINVEVDYINLRSLWGIRYTFGE